MRLTSWIRSPAWLLLVLALAGCGTTEMVNMWHDPQYAEPPVRSAFVMAFRRDPVLRRQWEDSFVKQLAKHGVNATASYQVYPDALPDTNAVRDYAEAHHDDAVIFTSHVGTDRIATFQPGYIATEPYYFRPLWGSYVTYYGDVFHPGYTETNTAVRIRTDVWRRTGRDEGQLVWSGTSQTLDPTSAPEFSHEVAELVTHELVKYRLIS